MGKWDTSRRSSHLLSYPTNQHGGRNSKINKTESLPSRNSQKCRCLPLSKTLSCASFSCTSQILSWGVGWRRGRGEASGHMIPSTDGNSGVLESWWLAPEPSATKRPEAHCGKVFWVQEDVWWGCVLSLCLAASCLSLKQKPQHSGNWKYTAGIQDQFQASARRQGGRPAKEKKLLCLPPQPPGPPPLPAHRPCRFLVTVPPSVVKIASSWKEFQNEIYVPLQLPKWLQLWQLNPLMC